MTQRRIYQDQSPYFVTTNSFAQYPSFCDDRFARYLSKNIFLFCQEYKFTLYGYCIMPDHLHLLVKPNGSLNISRVMCAIKSTTATDLYKAGLLQDKLWHPRFMSRIINSRQEFDNKIRYIKNNPAAQGLELKYQKLPYLYICPEGLKSDS